MATDGVALAKYINDNVTGGIYQWRKNHFCVVLWKSGIFPGRINCRCKKRVGKGIGGCRA